MEAVKFGVSQNKVIWWLLNLASPRLSVSPSPVLGSPRLSVLASPRLSISPIWRREILVNIRNSPNSPNIIARQNLLIYSNFVYHFIKQKPYSVYQYKQHSGVGSHMTFGSNNLTTVFMTLIFVLPIMFTTHPLITNSRQVHRAETNKGHVKVVLP